MQLSAARAPEFAAVYRAYYSFVWRTVRHLGVEPARIDDAVQDTFLVVYRRLPEFVGRAAVRTWLFEIARRVASSYRRSAAREAQRRSSLAETEVAAPPTASVAQAEAAELVHWFLGELDRDKAVIFVLAELEQWQAPEIAEELALNLNTVYSRLRAARQQLDRLVRRLDARDRRPRARSGAQVLGALLLVGPPSPPPWRLDAARESPALSDMLSNTWSIEPARSASILSAGGSTATGLSLAGAGLAAVLVFGPPPPPPPPEPAPIAAPAVASAPHDVPLAAPRVDPPPPEPPPPPPPRTARRDPAPAGLAEELALVESIRAALLAGDDRTTLELVARHQRRFTAGVFVPEAAAAAIEARCRLGEHERARRDADAFVQRWPASPLAARVAGLCRS